MQYRYETPPRMLRLRGHRLAVTSAVASEDARVLFTAGKEGSIIKWDLRTGKRQSTFQKVRLDKQKKKMREGEVQGHTDEVLALALSSDARYLASGGKDRRIGVWDVGKGEWVRSFGGHRDTISVRFDFYSVPDRVSVC
jgi:ribosomal RNA-processing protein 9